MTKKWVNDSVKSGILTEFRLQCYKLAQRFCYSKDVIRLLDSNEHNLSGASLVSYEIL